ncbi:MAG: histidine phosphatase family protein [Humibacillus sp.]|nr:histidine phosphatase family protein [Humibacillus sp.]MDN5777263.1 histidine phosphatase family protein [Humibacillus sp.]
MDAHRQPHLDSNEQPSPIMILVRHGRTTLNATGRLRGHSDPPLDETGTADVARLANRLAPLLADHRPHRILSSPLVRATQTAHAIADRAGLTVAVDDRLLDRDYGRWNGELTDEVVKQWGSVDAAPGVESRASVAARVRGLLAEPVTDAPLVLVTHDANLNAMLEQLDPSLADTPLDPGSWSLIGDAGDGTLSVISTNNH